MAKAHGMGAKRRVFRVGKALMERVYGPKWFKSVNVEILDISYAETCPFVQASGTDSYWEACGSAHIDFRTDLIQRAGVIPYNSSNSSAAARRSLLREIESLNRQWRLLILGLQLQEKDDEPQNKGRHLKRRIDATHARGVTLFTVESGHPSRWRVKLGNPKTLDVARYAQCPAARVLSGEFGGLTSLGIDLHEAIDYNLAAYPDRIAHDYQNALWGAESRWYEYDKDVGT